ncbi:response regulator transcription factor [Psychrobacillus sp. MER TA 171]|uniref:response regulator transcription factor n=1 Tax=Psychrobacillus sp. MER TA 171 TaxID=2939577 RepID=UPI002041AAC1|nr:response regulator transcription factor [Psychrobacillus sp. MER TA 171]MCM3358262.1 response regulator transcription factor [Psychrobacillus sp. MER TA 171]
MYKILVIEDDQTIYEELKMLLRVHGYEPVDALPCDLVLLDINLPGENGFEICRRIRETSDIPIIFLTARDSNEDELIGFGVGADDYIRKPYNTSILLARIARLLARKVSTTSEEVRGLSLEIANLKASFKGQSIELTKNETRILASLMKKELITREEIIEELWNDSLYIDENTLYVNINRLRDKLKQIGAVEFIKTVRGVGYRL